VRLERCVVRPFFYEDQALMVLTVHVYGVRNAARLSPRTMNMLKAELLRFSHTALPYQYASKHNDHHATSSSYISELIAQ
jgi:hypothetical protein